MSNLAVKLPKPQHQQRNAQPQRKTNSAPQTSPQKANRRMFSGFELSVIGLFFGSLLILGFMYMSNTYHLYKENRTLEQLKGSVQSQTVKNKDLQTEIERLSSYDRIMTKAKELGLTINSENIQPINE